MNKIQKSNLLVLLTLLTAGLMISASIYSSTNAYTNNNFPFINPMDDDDDDSDHDGVNDDDEDHNKRVIEVEIQDEEAEINSKFESGGIENEIKIVVKEEDDSLRVKFQYETEIGSNETELEFSVRFFEIIEYVDNNTDNMFNDSIDTIIQTYELGDFQPIDYTLTNSDDGNLYSFVVSTVDNVFTAKVFASDEFLNVSNTIIAPTEAKIDIIITDFPYNNSESALALNVKLEVEGETSYEEETEDESHDRAKFESEIELNVDDYIGFFSWSEVSVVDGVEQPVTANYYDNEGAEQKLYLNYHRGDLIIHDPKVGAANILILQTNTANLSIFTVSGVILLATISIIAIGVIKFKRRKE